MKTLIALTAAAVLISAFTVAPVSAANKGAGIEAAKSELVMRGGRDDGPDDHGNHGAGHP
jgi:hypothetical protein